MSTDFATKATRSLTYADAGVDVAAGNRFVEDIKSLVRQTHGPAVLSNIGGFSACFQPDLSGMSEPVLCACTDGVGTKVKLAQSLGNHTGIGIDLVAMCANDLIVNGATPLFFLDYYATGHLAPKVSSEVLKSIVAGCKQAQLALIGGETAEMPGVYQGDDYDLAGFAVGMVDKAAIIDGQKVVPGDVLIGLPSTGLHSNGYALVRRLIEQQKIDINSGQWQGQSLADLLLIPTQIYVASIKELLDAVIVKAMAHITGGGIAENLARSIPEGVAAMLQRDSWQKPSIYQWLDQYEEISLDDREKTFNEGLGMIVCVAEDQKDVALDVLNNNLGDAWVIGSVEKRSGAAPSVQLV